MGWTDSEEAELVRRAREEAREKLEHWAARIKPAEGELAQGEGSTRNDSRPLLPERDRRFSSDEWAELISRTMKSVVGLGRVKGGEYAGDVDRLANFRRNALSAETSMEFVWRVYAAKHWDALMQLELDIRNGRLRERAEPIEGRIDDMITYLILLKAILSERGVA